MAPFIVNPHGRLQEWVAEEKGYFKQVGLDLEHSILVITTGNTRQSSSEPALLLQTPLY